MSPVADGVAIYRSMSRIKSRAYRPAEGGEKACNSRTASTEGEMLTVTKFRTEI